MTYPFSGTHKVTQKFGENPAYYAQFGMKGHNGIDYAMAMNTPVLASEDGVASVLSDPNGFGNYVQIVGKYKTLYAHLNKATVKNGQSVKAGDQIGLSGNSGNSTGPHLHFGVKPIPQDNNNGYFGAIDPAPLLKEGNMYQEEKIGNGDAANIKVDTGEPLSTTLSKKGWKDSYYAQMRPAFERNRREIAKLKAENELLKKTACTPEERAYLDSLYKVTKG